MNKGLSLALYLDGLRRKYTGVNRCS